ncbi:MAG: DUF4102 domain-containing protein [Spiribacter salinus]|uniref:DUF4102 domain-containing protein n=1 Tax=Spiribacter salinus TaxID=1335746 RepID=A0A540VSP3_9GAMM|nr:MAG: DUF4102 domain-containing protein [Spiribacter salinus]
MPRTSRNTVSFTQRNLAHLDPPQKGRKVIYDTNPRSPRGLVVRVFPSGAKSFGIYYDCPDRAGQAFKTIKRYALGEEIDLADVRERATQILGDVARGVDPNSTRRHMSDSGTAELENTPETAVLSTIIEEYIESEVLPLKRPDDKIRYLR